jgi:4-carboxymuconolactone decarboxylase
MDLEQKKMLEEIKKKRGFVLDFHKILIEEDLEFLQRYDVLISTAYARQRNLSKKVKELVFIAALTELQADKSHIGAHMKVTMDNGAHQAGNTGGSRMHFPALWGSSIHERIKRF